ncbi:hypothetical protein T492DRAFT_853325 [Pavlovales sp. CCMP2436]|nr:hypothetical protein T492DRAFT_853325 [Pavlovales sp. CCMP2436]
MCAGQLHFETSEKQQRPRLPDFGTWTDVEDEKLPDAQFVLVLTWIGKLIGTGAAKSVHAPSNNNKMAVFKRDDGEVCNIYTLWIGTYTDAGFVVLGTQTTQTVPFSPPAAFRVSNGGGRGDGAGPSIPLLLVQPGDTATGGKRPAVPALNGKRPRQSDDTSSATDPAPRGPLADTLAHLAQQIEDAAQQANEVLNAQLTTERAAAATAQRAEKAERQLDAARTQIDILNAQLTMAQQARDAAQQAAMVQQVAAVQQAAAAAEAAEAAQKQIANLKGQTVRLRAEAETAQREKGAAQRMKSVVDLARTKIARLNAQIADHDAQMARVRAGALTAQRAAVEAAEAARTERALEATAREAAAVEVAALLQGERTRRWRAEEI